MRSLNIKMDSYNLKISVADTVHLGVRLAEKLLAISPMQFFVTDDVQLPSATVWTPALARSPSAYFNRLNLEAAS